MKTTPPMNRDPRLTYSTRVRETVDGLQLREKWNDVQLAERLGISKTAVGKWRAGTAVPNPQMAVTLADLAGISIRWLIMGTGNRQARRQTAASEEVLRMAERLAQVSSDSLDVLREVFADQPALDSRVAAVLPPVPQQTPKAPPKPPRKP